MSIGHDAATESHTNSTRDQDQSDMQEDHDHSESHPQDSQPILDSQEGTGELVAAAETETLQAGEAWATQPTYYQLFQCRFDPPRPENNHLDSSSYGIVKSFSTRSTFNKTVGEIRLEQLGIQDDDVKMTNGRENDFFKAVKWSPDGTCLLSSSNDNCLRIFALVGRMRPRPVLKVLKEQQQRASKSR
ncbi:hypothetical protein BGX31_011473 [Mortierella sp. GBA43]|nr:hypothetical protein BGX31_011473 [Mortierella sp. GBA43]